MSFEVQGRQYHQWFGHGTGDGAGSGERELTEAEIARVVAAGAAASLGGERRAEFQAWLGKGGLTALGGALPVWAAGSGTAPERFRAALVGPRLSEAGAEALQDAGRLVRDARDAEVLQAASGRLAAAVEAGGAEWLWKLSYAIDAAVYSQVNALVPHRLSKRRLHSCAVDVKANIDGFVPRVRLVAGTFNLLAPDPNATGPHSTYRVNPATGQIENYATYAVNPRTGDYNAILRYRGKGKAHANVRPPFILEPQSGKGVGSAPVVPRPAFPSEIPRGGGGRGGGGAGAGDFHSLDPLYHRPGSMIPEE